MKKMILAVVATVVVFTLAACGNGAKSDLKGTVELDGSSTVFPIAEAVAEEFGTENPGVRVAVGESGTGGGFKRFCAGETAISNASRTIKDEEAAVCKSNGVEYIEMAIAHDGLSVLVNPQNTWVDQLTIEELNKIFKKDSKVKTWADVRAGFPAEEIKIYSPGSDSGTFDYFTKAVNGTEKEMRNDSQVTFSENDNALVQGIAGEKGAIGYFGYAYYVENQDKLKLVPVDSGSGAVKPSKKTIIDGTYKPLSRLIYIYVSKKELARPEVKAFAQYFMDNAAALSEEVGYVALSEEAQKTESAKLK